MLSHIPTNFEGERVNREERRAFFRRKNERRRLVKDPHQRWLNREMGRLLSLRAYKKKDESETDDNPKQKPKPKHRKDY